MKNIGEIRIVRNNSKSNQFWKDCIEEVAKTDDFRISEVNMLLLLKFGLKWLDMVPQEWIEIYGAIFDESDSFTYDESQLRRIGRDVTRTFGAFSKQSKIADFALRNTLETNINSLRIVLKILSHKLNYTQGMNYIAAMIILVEPSIRNCFILLCFLLFQRHIHVLMNPNSSSLSEYVKVFDRKLRKFNKPAYKHFQNLNYFSLCFAVEWFTTCFIVSNPGMHNDLYCGYM